MQRSADFSSPFGLDLLFSRFSTREAVPGPFAYTLAAQSAQLRVAFTQLLREYVTVRFRVPVEESPDVLGRCIGANRGRGRFCPRQRQARAGTWS
jgi:uncharacterized protein involved in type VI secretion and phage assembly